MRGDQTLQDLHHAIFDSFGRHEEQMYEFQFGKGPMDPKGPRYVLPGAFEVSVEDGAPAAGRVDQATLDSLDLDVGRSFTYWFDFGDDWWHQVNVNALEDKRLKGKYPKVTKRVGENPPQYADLDKEPVEEARSQGLDDGEAADAACLVAELHLSKGDYQKAIEAFTRALETNPTVDAYQGRASAHRALAIEDEVAAQELN
jgi:tetratricopeptide (TPR) repeat protein